MNSEVGKLAIMIAGAALAAWYVKKEAGAAFDALKGTATDMVDSVVATANRAVSAVYNPENAVSATAGGNATVPNWSSTRNITPLIAYFQQFGNTTASRNEARAAGWSNDEISIAVATMGTLNGYY